MGRARLEYDDSGTTFYYFLISFYALILLPITYFLIPRKKKGKDSRGVQCQCEPCLTKRARLQRSQPNKWMATTFRYVVLLVLWAILLYMLYKVLTADKEYTEYDPFEILQLDPGASMSEIKKQYRRLSKVFHPDKQGGDQDMFMKIAKAYEALTDDVSRENWEKWGNPDGPQAATFGIALPSWVVEKQNSLWVLALYMAIFMVLLPSLVGVWWYRSIKYGSSNVLIQTTQIFAYFLSRSRTIPTKRVVMILTGAAEFNPAVSQSMPTRASDNQELSRIMSSKTLPYLQPKTKEQFLGAAYSVKTRILLHSHLERLPLHSTFLESDQRLVLAKCPQLVQEMVSVLCQLWLIAMQGQGHSPSADVFEEVMKTSGVIVQAMWLLGNSPLLQLPHLSPALLRHFRTKKRNISTIEQFASLSEPHRRSLVRSLTDDQYSDLLAVSAKFPKVTIEAKTQVMDDEHMELITAKSVVTLSVKLIRKSLQDKYNILGLEDDTLTSPKQEQQDCVEGGEVETLCAEEVGEDSSAHNGNPPPVATPSVAKKAGKKGALPAKKKGKGQAKLRRRTVNPKKVKKNDRVAALLNDEDSLSDSQQELDGKTGERKGSGSRHSAGKIVSSGHVQSKGSFSESSGEESGSEDVGKEDEEQEWNKLQQNLSKHSKKKFEQKPTESHPVHAPYFPDEKYEVWWLYVVDRKKRAMTCLPMKVAGLMTEYTTDIQFQAPDRPGLYRYSVVLRSDSYLDLTFTQEIKLNVGAPLEVSGRSQWADLEKEEEEQEMIEESESEFSSDDSDSD